MADLLLTATQEDRNAAADLIEYLAGGLTASSRKMRNGDADDYGEVQAFARHRMAETEACAKIAEAEAGQYADDGEGDAWIALRIAKRIRERGI